MSWLIDPATRQLMPAKRGESIKPHGPEWLIERDEFGMPVRMYWAGDRDHAPSCVENCPNLPDDIELCPTPHKCWCVR
jgi:hypothetical protein